MPTSTITMILGGVNFSPLFPLYARDFTFIRADDQGEGVIKVKCTLGGFLQGGKNSQLMAQYQGLLATTGANQTTFTYVSDGVHIHDEQVCWLEAYSEPEDNEYGKTAVGDYSISIYWFQDATTAYNLACSYGAYTFLKTPKWGRDISPNRDSHRAALYGSTATVTLEGMLYGTGHTDLMNKVNALQNAFTSDSLLTYGVFAQQCRIMSCSIQPVTIRNYATYTITLKYDIGTEASLTAKMNLSRIHQNPVITEEPFCDRRTVELMNLSGQVINYNLKVTAADLDTCRAILATEATNRIIGGGIELPGGGEDWDENEVSVSVAITKFYPQSGGVIANLDGTFSALGEQLTLASYYSG